MHKVLSYLPDWLQKILGRQLSVKLIFDEQYRNYVGGREFTVANVKNLPCGQMVLSGSDFPNELQPIVAKVIGRNDMVWCRTHRGVVIPARKM